MKKILISMCVIAAMASCNRSEIYVEDTTPAPISFAPQFGNSVASRATDGNLPTSTQLGVYAYNGTTPAIYDGITNLPLAYTSTAPAGWYLTPKEHYYPNDASSVSFWAYGPKDETHIKSTLTCDATKGPSFTMTLANTDKTVDVYATQAVKTGTKSSSGTPIAFALKRVMAQVKFTAKTATTTDATNFDVKIYSITVATKGTAKYDNKVWGTFSNDLTWTVISGEQTALTGTAASIGSSVNLIPGSEVTITVKAKVYKKGASVVIADQTATLSLTGASGKEFLAQGNSYTYAITVTPNVGQITFAQPTLTNWETATGSIGVN